jgi:hypothetical protein
MAISPLNALWLEDPHDLQAMAASSLEEQQSSTKTHIAVHRRASRTGVDWQILNRYDIEINDDLFQYGTSLPFVCPYLNLVSSKSTGASHRPAAFPHFFQNHN